jgi:hypothetical protein
MPRTTTTGDAPRRRTRSALLAAVALLMTSLVAVVAAPPASAASHCRAYVSRMYKSDATVIVHYTIKCDVRASRITVTGVLSGARPAYEKPGSAATSRPVS